MQGPSSEIRDEIARDMDRVENEPGLEDVLDHLSAVMTDDIAATTNLDQSFEQLAAVEAWASLISYCVGRHYAPASPWPRRMAGWGNGIIQRVRDMAMKLEGPLRAAAQASGANSIAVAVGFPFGVSVEIGWTW